MSKKIKNFLVLFCFAFLSFQGYSQIIITSFENQDEFSKIEVSDKVEVSQSTDFPALGTYSCKAEYPENGGTISLEIEETVSEQIIESSSKIKKEIIHVFVWSNELAELILILKDANRQSFIKQISLEQGANHIQLKLSEVEGVDLKMLKSINIGTRSKNVFYLDYVAFDRFYPDLETIGRWDAEYLTDIKTPHFPWGEKLAGGTIKSYSISPVFDGRGIIELAERLDLDFEVTTIGRRGGADKWGLGDFYHSRSRGVSIDGAYYSLAHNYIADDLMFSPEFDVIIWPGLHKWETYPQQIRDAILTRVKNGTGLILLYPVGGEGSDIWDISPLKSTDAFEAQVDIKDTEIATMPEQLDMSEWSAIKPHYISRGISFEAFPWGHMGVYPYKNNSGETLVESAKGNPVLSVSNYGKGRVVALAYPERGFLPRVDNPWETGLNYQYWEYMWSMIARSVVWASNQEPDTFIETVTRTSDGIKVKLSNIKNNTFIDAQVIDDFGNIEEEITTAVKAKQNVADIKFNKKLVGGKHIVNIQLKSDNGVFDWYSLQFETSKNAEIVSVKNSELEIHVGKNVQSEIVLKSANSVSGTLTTRIYDNYNRLVDEDIQEVSFQGEKTFNVILNSENVISNLAIVESILEIDGNQQDRKTAEVFFLQPRLWDDYDVTMYHFGPNPVPGVWSAVDKQLQNLNVTTLAAYTLANSKHANYKVQAQTRISGVESPDRGPDLDYYKKMKATYIETGDKSVLKRKYGLKDSVYLNSIRDDLTTRLGNWKKFSPSAYYIYEEPSVTRYDDALDLCFRKSTLNAMRVWLEEEYASLTNLNEQWGTDFSKWDDVIPDDSREALERGNYSSWADHRTFMEICWADQFKFVQDIVNEIDPGGLVQLSGTQAASSHNGYDYSRLNKFVGQMNPYDIDNQLEYHHNFNSDIKVSGQAGYGALGKGVIFDYYHHLFLKETGGSYIFWQVSCLNPDLRLCQSGVDLKEGFDEMLKRGIGRLVGSYEPENELKIAIHFSYPSVHAAWIVDGEILPEARVGSNNSKTLEQLNRNRDGWVKILHDAGHGFSFMSYSSIEAGSLISEGYKVLILPMSYAISDEEVKQIEEFVDKGGILVADALPGVMDDHNKFRKERAFADIFGIESRTYAREELVTPESETDLKIKNAEVLLKDNDSRELLYNKYGRGSAFLLNYFMDDYPEEKLSGKSETSLLKIGKLFETENLKSGIILTKLTGEPTEGVEKYSFSEDEGSTKLLGLLPAKSGEDEVINLHIDKSVHLYDIRNKKYLGEGNDFKIELKTSVPELFGLVSGTIENIKVDAPSTIKPGDKVELNFEITGSGISDLKSVVRVDVFNPAGKVINYYSKNCDINGGTGSYSFNLALNEQPGIWEIRLTEVISGVEKEVSVDVNVKK